MATLLEQIQGIVGDVLPGMLSRSAVTIHVYAEGTFTPGSGSAPTYTSYSAPNAGFVDTEGVSLRFPGALLATERAVLIYVTQLPVGCRTQDAETGLWSSTLKADDEITISGSRSKLVRQIAEDPAQATQTWAVVDT